MRFYQHRLLSLVAVSRMNLPSAEQSGGDNVAHTVGLAMELFIGGCGEDLFREQSEIR